MTTKREGGREAVFTKPLLFTTLDIYVYHMPYPNPFTDEEAVV